MNQRRRIVVLACLLVGLGPCVARAGDAPAAPRQDAEAICAQQGEIIAGVVRLRDVGAARSESFASAYRELEHSTLDQAAFKRQLAADIQRLYDPAAHLDGSPEAIGRTWQARCACQMAPGPADRCGGP